MVNLRGVVEYHRDALCLCFGSVPKQLVTGFVGNFVNVLFDDSDGVITPS